MSHTIHSVKEVQPHVQNLCKDMQQGPGLQVHQPYANIERRVSNPLSEPAPVFENCHQILPWSVLVPGIVLYFIVDSNPSTHIIQTSYLVLAIHHWGSLDLPKWACCHRACGIISTDHQMASSTTYILIFAQGECQFPGSFHPG